MKKNLAVALLAISLTSSSAAIADTATPAPKASVNSAYKAALDKWKADNQAAVNAFKGAMADYLAKAKANAAARKSANDSFKTAIDAAKSAFQSAIKAATTAEAKTAAVNARKAAVAAATAARDAALKAIAPLPTKPVKPTLAPKPDKPTS